MADAHVPLVLMAIGIYNSADGLYPLGRVPKLSPLEADVNLLVFPIDGLKYTTLPFFLTVIVAVPPPNDSDAVLVDSVKEYDDDVMPPVVPSDVKILPEVGVAVYRPT